MRTGGCSRGGTAAQRLAASTVPGSKRPSALQQPFPPRVGADTLEMRDGADLLLPIAAAWPPYPRDWTVSQSWQLTLGGGSAPIGISGEGRLPGPLVVPASPSPRPSDGIVAVQLSVHSRIDLGNRWNEGYSGEIPFRASLRWTVRRTESAPSG